MCRKRIKLRYSEDGKADDGGGTAESKGNGRGEIRGPRAKRMKVTERD